MPCCLLTIAAFFPRGALVIMWLIGYTFTAFETRLWPLLGFFFMPWTTCAYAIGINEAGGIHNWALVLVIIAVVMDLGHMGGGGVHGHRKRVVYYRHHH
jgi:hypothetical protein